MKRDKTLERRILEEVQETPAGITTPIVVRILSKPGGGVDKA